MLNITECILAILCHGEPLLTNVPVPQRASGLFSQLNFIAQVVLEHMFRGARPSNRSVLEPSARDEAMALPLGRAIAALAHMLAVVIFCAWLRLSFQCVEAF